MVQRSNTATERAVMLDPNLLSAAAQLVVNHAERGQPAKAYQDAQAMVRRHPDSSIAHFTLGYVLRYAGKLEQSASECDSALALDPGNYSFRSCAWAFMELGRFQRARDFIRLDSGSEWERYVMPSLLLREGNIQEARKAVKQMPTAPRDRRDLLEACLDPQAGSTLDVIAHQAETTEPTERDPELAFYQGSILAFCGKESAAAHVLRTAIDHDYCAYSQLESDPMLAKLRGTSEFDQLLAAAQQCQHRYAGTELK